MSREDVPLNCVGTWVCDCSYCVAERDYDWRGLFSKQDPSELDEHQRVPVEMCDEEADTIPCPPAFDD